MTTLEMSLSPDLQTLIETRLDFVDRVLLDARVSRAERTSILQELEGQILEQVERRSAQPSRSDVLAVFSEMDPPEAFLTETDRPELEPRRPRHPQPLERTSNTPSTPACGLALWAGTLVGGVSLMTGVLMTFPIWLIPEVVLGLTGVLQVVALVGAALGFASLMRRARSAASKLERIVAGVSTTTGPLTLTLGVIFASLFLLESNDGGEVLAFVLAGFVGGAWMHGAWLTAATAFLWFRSKSAPPIRVE